MAIKIKFDLNGNPELPTIILATRSGKKLGQLDVNAESVDLSDKLNDASEFSFTLNKYVDEKITNLWDKVVDFKLVYCKEWDMWFEIKVELDEETETIKTVFCTQLGQAELSQIMLYDIHINEEGDSNWNTDKEVYKSTILYNEKDTEASLLHRLLKDKAPHYSIAHVDSTIANEQRTFSFDGTSIVDAFSEIGEEIGCLFVYNSNSDENGNIQRTISVYDLQQKCLNNDCGHRGEFTDKCPKCGSTNIKYGYGNDTLIFVTADELAAGGIELTTDTDSVKNCFKLEAGDDLMTATVRNCNPNGTDYIWYFSEDMKADMSEELVKKIESYDDLYKEYYNDKEFNIDGEFLNGYNELVTKYSVYKDDLLPITNPIKGYSSLMNAYYNVIDLALYLESSLMPSIKMEETDATKQAALLTTSSLSPVAVKTEYVKSISKSTADSSVLSMAKIIVRSTYKVEVNTSTISTDVYSDENGDYKLWEGNFIVTNYSDEEDFAVSNTIQVKVNIDEESFIKQKIDKALNKTDTDNYSISGLFEKELVTTITDDVYSFSGEFYEELKKYALNPLTSFYDACQTCIDILIEQGVGNNETWSDTEEGSDANLYEKLYMPYYNKLMAIEAEIKIREDEINLIKGVYTEDDDGNEVLVADGLATCIVKLKNEVQEYLNFEKYLGNDLWLEFCTYRREDKYTNDNYISDGLDNAKLFKRAKEFIEVAENEIFKASELQHSISTSLKNLLAIKKFKPLVDSFEVGNWIRVRIDDVIYKLRLLEYEIDYGSFDDISVEFSDITKVRNGVTDTKNVLDQAKSMATSYSSVRKQAKQGDDAKNTVNDWLSNGLNSALVQIQNNDNEEITINKSGLLGRSYNDITDSYSPEQFKLTHNIMAYTTDNWRTVSAALGKHDYEYYDANKIKQQGIDYGLSSKFVTAGYVNGSQIIGGEIYSQNYTPTTGTYMNLNDGTFNFAGGKLTYSNNELSVNGKITATSGEIGGCSISDGVLKIGNVNIGEKLTADSIDATEIKVAAANVTGTLTASQIDATSLKVKAANIEGRLTASQINTTGLIAENISGTTISGKTISGGSINIGSGNFVVDSNGKMTAKSGIFSGSLNAASGTFAGTLSAVDGTFTELSAGTSTFTPTKVTINANGQGYIVIGDPDCTYDDGTPWVDITIRPAGTEVGNVGTPTHKWDCMYARVGTISTSDRNKKQNIVNMNDTHEQLFNSLKPVTFEFVDGGSGRTHYGFISQDVEDSLADIGLTGKDFAGFCKDSYLDKDGKVITEYGLRYTEFIALNTYMIQKLNKRILELENRLQELEN